MWNIMSSRFQLRVVMSATISICFVEGSCIFMFFVSIYVYWCPTPFPCQMMFVSFNGNTTDITRGAGTAYPSGAHEFIPGFQWGSCSSIFIFLCGVLQIVVCPFVLFSFIHCVVCRYTAFDYTLWYLQTFLKQIIISAIVFNNVIIRMYCFAVLQHSTDT